MSRATLQKLRLDFRDGLGGQVPRLTLALVLSWAGALAAQQAKPATTQPTGRFEIVHRTEYRYDKPVRILPHTLRLIPQAAADPASLVREHRLSLTGVPHRLTRQLDAEGNAIAVAEFGRAPTQSLTVEVRLTVELPGAEPPRAGPPNAELPTAAPVKLPLAYGSAEAGLAPYRAPLGPPEPALRAFLERCPETADDARRWLTELTIRVHQSVRHSARWEPGVRSPEQTLRDGGACRDVTGLMIDVLRRRGWAARWVSGYVLPEPALADRSDRAHAADLHAWVEAYLPGAGWVGVDATFGRAVDGRYVPLARSADWMGTMPLEGAFEWADFARTGAGRDQLRTEVTVRRVPQR